MSCPCGSEKEYEDCCGPIISGTVPAPTAEALMRSRYSAFVKGVPEHIERTDAPELREDFNRDELEQMMRDCEWRGLKIRRTVETGDIAEVEFVIRFRYNRQDMVQTELSSFRRENGQWLYVTGEINPKQMPVRNERKIRRNDPCPCGSGKKAKKCCGTDTMQA